jgi:enterochelin esterase-like enzyme
MRRLIGIELVVILSLACLVLCVQASEFKKDDGKPTSPLLAALLQNPESAQSLWKGLERSGAPIVESLGDTRDVLVTFVYRSPSTASVRLRTSATLLLSGDNFSNVNAAGLMTRIPGTDVHYISLQVRDDLRLAYHFEADSAGVAVKHLDPLNNSTFSSNTRFAASLLDLPAAPNQPWKDVRSPGKWDEHSIASAVLEKTETFWVYTSSDYATIQDGDHALVIGMDPVSFGQLLPTSKVIEYLNDNGAIGPTILVAAPDLAWVGDERGSYDDAVTFLADEFLPFLRERYRITDSPEGIVLAGESRKGMLATYAAFRRPEAFGKVLSLSGSYYWRPVGSDFEWLPALIAGSLVRPVRLYLAAGELEKIITPTNRGHYLLSTNRHMRNVLEARGYAHRYAEFYGGHNAVNWQDQIEPALRYLLGDFDSSGTR